jgi:phenol 2-monooxygenase (NADPH)
VAPFPLPFHLSLDGFLLTTFAVFNLGWKLASVLNGTATRDILSTYQSERRKIARELIAFDHEFSRLFSGRPAKDVMDEAGISMHDFKDTFAKRNLFATSVAVDYGVSFLVAREGNTEEQGDGRNVRGSRVVGKENLTSNVKIGMRMPNYKVQNWSNARPWEFQKLLKSDGRWRIMVFAGDVSVVSQIERIRKLGQELAAPKGLIKHFTSKGKEFDGLIKVLTIHAAPRVKTELFDFPEVSVRIMKVIDGIIGRSMWMI